jgi:hypothetical protein
MRDYNLSQERICARCGDKASIHVCIPEVIDMLTKNPRFWALVLSISCVNLFIVMVLARLLG